MEALKQFEALIGAKIAVFKTVYSIMCLEARLAGMSVLPVLLTVIMVLVVFITTWATLMLLMGYSIFLATHRFILSTALVLLFNSVILIALIRYLSFNLKSMSFQKTRDYFSEHKSTAYEKLEKTAQDANCPDGQKIALRDE